jgi:molecular chaperone GrpE
MTDDLHEDVDFELEEDLGDIGAARAKLQKLKAELAEVKKERQEYLDGWQRCKADSINSKREALESAERMSSRTREALIEEIIPVLDSFDMAVGGASWESVDSNWRAGIEHIRTQLLNVLERYGVTRFGKSGEDFNPHLHEAVQKDTDGSLSPNKIIKVLRFGYMSGEKVLRPAQIIVSSDE